MRTDEHGQPKNIMFNRRKTMDRTVDELIGICRGVIADGVVTQAEAEFLEGWIRRNDCLRSQWPGNIIYARLFEYLEDGRLDEDEKADLLDLLSRTTGECGPPVAEPRSTLLPYDQPMPPVEFDGRSFVVTGKFVYGPRTAVETEIVSLGGRLKATVTQETNYLVIGYLGSRDWAHSTHGRKIETAVGLRGRGHGVAIVSEDHWTSELARELGF